MRVAQTFGSYRATARLDGESFIVIITYCGLESISTGIGPTWETSDEITCRQAFGRHRWS
jgi:hypothetical protein